MVNVVYIFNEFITFRGNHIVARMYFHQKGEYG